MITRSEGAYVEEIDQVEGRLAVIMGEQLRVCQVFEVVLQTQTAQRLNLIFMSIIAHPNFLLLKIIMAKLLQELIIVGLPNKSHLVQTYPSLISINFYLLLL